MQKNTRIERCLRIAIRREKEAHAFYVDLAARVEDATTKQTLEFLAGEEVKHREFLENYLSGGLERGTLRMSDVVDYKIVEHIEEEEEPMPEGPLDPRKALLIAAKREQASNRFYQGLSEIHPEGPVRDLLLRMANEELRHKEKVEYLYANVAFPQTAGG